MIISRIFIENMRTWIETIEFMELGEKKLHNTTVSTHEFVKFYERKSDELA